MTFLSNWKKWVASASIILFVILSAVEGTWGTALHLSPLMFVDAVIMVVMLSYAAISSVRTKQPLPGLFSHAGLCLVLAGALLRPIWFVEAQMLVSVGVPENEAISEEGRLVRLPFSVGLEEFRIDYYADGISPRQFTSVLAIEGKTVSTSVNHPFRFRDYKIYQFDYDHDAGGFSVLKVVRDPMWPVVLLGIIFLAAGALFGIGKHWHSKWVNVSMLAVAVIFAAFSLYRINFGTMMPALRSFWFIPHVVLYMLAYSALAIALIVCIVRAMSGKSINAAAGLLGTASSLLLLGMLCGAVWAKAAWGDWWTWDAKECWACVTWMLTLLGSHFPAFRGRRTAVLLASIVLSFLAMQIAWYGVDWLPSAQSSLHSYR